MTLGEETGETGGWDARLAAAAARASRTSLSLRSWRTRDLRSSRKACLICRRVSRYEGERTCEIRVDKHLRPELQRLPSLLFSPVPLALPWSFHVRVPL